MTATRTRIGFIGLGHMGGNMAERFLAAGYPVYGEERNREHAEPQVEQGLQWLDTAREVADAVEVVFTSLPDDRVLEQVASGPDGILAGLAAGTTWVDTSTVSPQASRELAERVRAQGAWMLDAPVSGSVPQVQIGDADDHGRRRRGCLPSRRAAPARAGHADPHRRQRAGARAQARDQHQPRRPDARVRRRAAPGGAVGVDRQRALDVMESSPIGSPMLRARASIILDPPEEAWFDLSFMHKDIELALDAARELDIPLPTAAARRRGARRELRRWATSGGTSPRSSRPSSR